MSKGKTHKLELGTHRSTEVAAEKAIIATQVNAWVDRLNEAERSIGDYRAQVNACADILEELAKGIKDNKIQPEVISEVMQRGSWLASLEVVRQRAARTWMKESEEWRHERRAKRGTIS